LRIDDKKFHLKRVFSNRDKTGGGGGRDGQGIANYLIGREPTSGQGIANYLIGREPTSGQGIANYLIGREPSGQEIRTEFLGPIKL